MLANLFSSLNARVSKDMTSLGLNLLVKQLEKTTMRLKQITPQYMLVWEGQIKNQQIAGAGILTAKDLGSGEVVMRLKIEGWSGLEPIGEVEMRMVRKMSNEGSARQIHTYIGEVKGWLRHGKGRYTIHTLNHQDLESFSSASCVKEGIWKDNVLIEQRSNV